MITEFAPRGPKHPIKGVITARDLVIGDRVEVHPATGGHRGENKGVKPFTATVTGVSETAQPNNEQVLLERPISGKRSHYPEAIGGGRAVFANWLFG